MIAEILNVGSEILLGDILNTNARYLSLKLSEIGIDVLWHTCVGDNEDRIKTAVDFALKRADLLFITGGLGPTKDDITKEVIAKICEKDLVEDLKIKEKIENKFKLRNLTITPNNYKQSLVIKGAKVFENNFGTAPAMVIEHDEKKIILLPGPPNELKGIFETKLKGYLEAFKDSVILSKNIYIYGLTESKVDDLISDILLYHNPTVGIYAANNQVRLRVTAKEKTNIICQEMINSVIEKIKERIGGFIYGIDVNNLQTVLVDVFKNKKKTLAVAESCTGGLISSKIVEVKSASSIFKLGAVCYSNEAKEKILNIKKSILQKYGAVSQIVAKQKGKE